MRRTRTTVAPRQISRTTVAPRQISAAPHRGPSGSAHRRAASAAAVLLLALALAAMVAASAGAATNPVLGAKSFALPYGEGFGTAEPSKIFNGGDPSGMVTKINWTGWGNPSAIGYGLNPIFKPHGGYYRKLARIELRATGLGMCGQQRAYTRLEARVPKHPGGKLGKWFPGPARRRSASPLPRVIPRPVRERGTEAGAHAGRWATPAGCGRQSSGGAPEG